MQLRQQLDRSTRISRHRHMNAYAAVVLQGSYHEAGDAGRWHAQPGDVLIHPPFTSHQDLIGSRAALVMNLPLPMNISMASPHHRVKDPDLLVRIAARDPAEAVSALMEQLLPGDAASGEPVDALAAALSMHDAPSIAAWSEMTGVRRETVFRRFQSAYGVSPTQYRIEARARLAWRAIIAGTQALGAIAAETGFADQAHMSRAVRALTGHAPGHWRATFVQDTRRPIP